MDKFFVFLERRLHFPTELKQKFSIFDTGEYEKVFDWPKKNKQTLYFFYNSLKIFLKKSDPFYWFLVFVFYWPHMLFPELKQMEMITKTLLL